MYLRWLVTVLAAAALAALLGLVLRRLRTGRRSGASPSAPPAVPADGSSLASLAGAVASAQETAKIAFDLRLLVRQGARLFAERARAKGLHFTTAIADNVPQWVRGDPSRLVPVFTSLLDNAVKFTDEGAVCLEVTFSRDAGRRPQLKFNVHDTGAGIDADTLAQLLKPEAPVHSAGARGLTAAHGLVALMAGTMGAESEPRGGSTFWFSVPVELVEPARTARLEERPHKPPAPENIAEPLPLLRRASVPGKRVLIVENDLADQVAILWGVRALGYLADVVSSGPAASEAWRRTPYDLVLLDSAIAGRDETVARIRRFDTGCIPIVAVSHAEDGQPVAIGPALDGHLAKPVCLIELARALDHWLGAAGSAYASDASSDRLSLPV